MDRLELLEKEIRLLKVSYCTCRYCVHADLYIPHYTRVGFDPRCELTGKMINPDDNACEDFMDRQLQDLEERFKECDADD